MAPQVSSTRDSTQRDGKVARSDDLRELEFCEWDGDKLIYILTE
jgi:hypothetical protein